MKRSLLLLSSFGAVVWTASPALAGSGACCANFGGLCVVIDGTFCTGSGQIYAGDGTSCRTAACPGFGSSPRGACCRSSNNQCIIVVGGQAGCDNQCGFQDPCSYRGDGTICDETPEGPFDNCPTCGDNQVNGPGEQCDGTSSSACPGACNNSTCRCPGGATVPTLSAWGLGGLALLLMSGVALKFGRRRAAT